MNYELAKKLKDAGFPQVGKNQDGYANDGGYEPTLSELIEACGSAFSALTRRFSGSESWIAHSNQFLTGQFGHIPIVADGNTLEEAVANLWLELNKQND